jgi:hypothetical protein
VCARALCQLAATDDPAARAGVELLDRCARLLRLLRLPRRRGA